MPTPTVVTFGELLLRLDATHHRRLVQSDSFGVSYTGGEANVAVCLSNWGIPTRLVSRVPQTEIGEACVNAFRRYGVDTSNVDRGGERLGILFVEAGTGIRSPRVLYDRSHTAFRDIEPAMFDWDAILEGAGWFHVTGTAPALGDGVRRTLHMAMSAARSKGIPISFDCSFRSALWSVEEAAAVLPDIVRLADVFIGSESDARNFLHITETGDDCLPALVTEFSLQLVAFTTREVRPTGNHIYVASAATPTEVHHSRTYDISVFDRIGAGDAFAAGLIRGQLRQDALGETTEFATAAAVLAHTIPGDFALISESEVQQLVENNADGRGWR